MKQSNNKAILVSIFVITFLLTSFFLVSKINKPNVELGDKNIKIVIVDNTEEVIYDEMVNTDAELLGDLLYQINESKETFTLEGDKDSEFGRYVSNIVDTDLESNEFWVYESENNEVCLAETMCPGVDALAIKNNDEFKFFVLKP